MRSPLLSLFRGPVPAGLGNRLNIGRTSSKTLGWNLLCFLTTDSRAFTAIGVFVQVLFFFWTVFLEFVRFTCVFKFIGVALVRDAPSSCSARLRGQQLPRPSVLVCSASAPHLPARLTRQMYSHLQGSNSWLSVLAVLLSFLFFLFLPFVPSLCWVWVALPAPTPPCGAGACPLTKPAGPPVALPSAQKLLPPTCSSGLALSTNCYLIALISCLTHGVFHSVFLHFRASRGFLGLLLGCLVLLLHPWGRSHQACDIGDSVFGQCVSESIFFCHFTFLTAFG